MSLRRLQHPTTVRISNCRDAPGVNLLVDATNQNEGANKKAEACQQAEEPATQTGNAASATISAANAEIIHETTTQAGRDGTKSVRLSGLQAEVPATSQGTAALATHEPQGVEVEHAELVVPGLESE